MPVWARQPRVEFPERAMSQGIQEGRAIVSCAALPAGGLHDCRVESEQPAGAGFGAAAITGAIQYGRLTPASVERMAPDGRVAWTVRFLTPEEPPKLAVLTDPAWSRPPRPAFPASARRAGIDFAEVRLDCEIAAGTGRLRNCRVLQDGPLGHRFGAAAIRSVRDASVSPLQLMTAASDAHAVFTVTFTD